MSFNKLWDFTPFKGQAAFKNKHLACCVHSHSDVGSLDGASTVDDMVKQMKSVGMTHVSITEHGSLNSAAAAHRIADKNGMKVIHGVEAYIFWPDDIIPAKTDKRGNKRENYYHMTIGFKTRDAYEAYCKLTKVIYSNERYYYGKPVMNWSELEEIAQHGITIGTGCVGSWCNKPILNGYGIQEAAKRIDRVIALVGKENVFDEVIVEDLTYIYKEQSEDGLVPTRLEVNECKPYFNHPDIQREINRIRLPYTKALGIKPLFSQDAHYAKKEHKTVQDAKNVDWIMSQFQHVMSAGEIVEEARKSHGDILTDRDYEELIDNTHAYADMFSGYEFLTIKTRKWKIPEVSSTPKRELVERVKSAGKVDLSNKNYVDRLNYEVSVLNSNEKLNGLNYLLMVSDIAKMAKEKGILMQLRGSGGGCLLAYALGFSITDSIKYDLPFERFLTKGRISANTPPDFDMDFSDKHGILKLMKERYGDCMAPLSIDMLMKPKSAMKDSERFILGEVRESTHALTKMMPGIPQGVSETEWMFGYTNDEGEHQDGYFEKSPELQKYAADNPVVWESVLNMCGVTRQKSVHACAVIIADEPIHHFMPLYRVGSGSEATLAAAFNPKDVEYVGGLKVDILGVTALNTIQRATASIESRTGIKMEWDLYPYEEEVFTQIYHSGHTSATFQTKTNGITNLCMQTKPKTVAEISNLIALYRPSCLDWRIERDDFTGNAVEYYVACSSGSAKPVYIHEEMRPIYESTFGVPLFQEQTLRVFRDIGGYTYEQAETVRRAIGKKDAKILAHELGLLSKTVISRGWTEEQAKELREMIEASSRYGFNSAHSCSYSIVSYNTAYLKNKHPVDFWLAELSAESDNEEKLREYSGELGEMILPVDILRSHPSEFIIEGEDKLRPPLLTLKGVGTKFAENIRKFMDNDLDSVCTRKPEKVKKEKAPKVEKPTKEPKPKAVKRSELLSSSSN
jgi:DNA polymerase-3 subunit alpha